MDKKIKALWIGALESGEYKQGVGQLRNQERGDSYCCLGVLCDVLSKEDATKYGVWDGDKFLIGEEYQASDQMDALGTAFIPNQLTADLGVSWGSQTTLARINDESDDFTGTVEWIKNNL